MRAGTKTIRPLCKRLGLKARCYSRHVQRLVVDFGAECSFGRAASRMLLHHGIAVSPSTVRAIALEHARGVRRRQEAAGSTGALRSKGAECSVTEMDGSMVPVVELI